MDTVGFIAMAVAVLIVGVTYRKHRQRTDRNDDVRRCLELLNTYRQRQRAIYREHREIYWSIKDPSSLAALENEQFRDDAVERIYRTYTKLVGSAGVAWIQHQPGQDPVVKVLESYESDARSLGGRTSESWPRIYDLLTPESTRPVNRSSQSTSA